MWLAFLLLLALSTIGDYMPPTLSSVVAPVAPVNTIEGNSVLADVFVDSDGKVQQISLLEGSPPFAAEAVRAIQQWRFRPARRQERPVKSRVSVLAVFRPSAFSNFGVGGPSLGFKGPVAPKVDHPPLPVSILDPGYPAAAIAAGVVVLELQIGDDGSIASVRVLRDVPQLTDFAKKAVKGWRYVPAMVSGKAASGTIVVAISFSRPVLSH